MARRRGRSVKRTQDSFQQLLAMDRRGESSGSIERSYGDAFALPTRRKAPAKAATPAFDSGVIPGVFTPPSGTRDKLGATKPDAGSGGRILPYTPPPPGAKEKLGAAPPPASGRQTPRAKEGRPRRDQDPRKTIVSGQYDERGPRRQSDQAQTKPRRSLREKVVQTRAYAQSKSPVKPPTSRRPVRSGAQQQSRSQVASNRARSQASYRAPGAAPVARRPTPTNRPTAASGSMARIAARRRARGG